jgi:hypothetical protein
MSYFRHADAGTYLIRPCGKIPVLAWLIDEGEPTVAYGPIGPMPVTEPGCSYQFPDGHVVPIEPIPKRTYGASGALS